MVIESSPFLSAGILFLSEKGLPEEKEKRLGKKKTNEEWVLGR